MNSPIIKNSCCIESCPKVFIFVALECEAKPLVKFFDLKKEAFNHYFTRYKNNEIVLTVSGVGKNVMAGSVAYTLARFPDFRHPVLLNVGIAGHKTQKTGSLLMAMKIVDKDSGKAFYPSMLHSDISQTSVVQTVSRPHNQYEEDCLYDMEASAFYEIAIRFSSIELIQCIKIVSDNQDSPIEKISAALASHWLTEQIPGIDLLVKNLLKLQESIAPISPFPLDEYHKIIKNWHFTVNGQLRLKALLMRWKILSSDAKLPINTQDFSNGREVLHQLETTIDRLEVYL